LGAAVSPMRATATLVATVSELAHTLPPANMSFTAASTLQNMFYDQATGLWGCNQLGAAKHDIGWWNCGNSLTALAQYTKFANDSTFKADITNTFEVNKEATAILCAVDMSTDDRAWWSLAWMDTYDVLGTPEALDRAKCYFNAEAKLWDTKCGGGVWWNAKRTYKNAITNELFAYQACRLVQYGPNDTYRDWCLRAWAWFVGSGMINAQGLVNDGLNGPFPNGECVNNNQTTWTYNQGVVLAAAAAYFQVTGNASAIELAIVIADATAQRLTFAPEGVLRESCDTSFTCDSSQQQFKGIFMRSLAILVDQVLSTPAAPEEWAAHARRYSKWIATNVESVWTEARTPDNQFAVSWVGPPAASTATPLTSALDLFNANLLVNSPGVHVARRSL